MIPDPLDRPDYPPEPWRDHAACKGMAADLFLPEKGNARGNDTAMAQAKAVCAQCAVRLPCLNYALDMGDEKCQGVWGGTTRNDRQRIRRVRRGAA